MKAETSDIEEGASETFEDRATYIVAELRSCHRHLFPLTKIAREETSTYSLAADLIVDLMRERSK